MALAKMKLVNVIGLMERLDDVVDALGRTGVFQPDETAEFFSDNENLIPINGTNEFAPLLDRLKELMAGADIRPKIVNADDKEEMSAEEIERFVNDADSLLGEQIRRRDALQKEIDVCDANIEKARHFVGLGLDVRKVAECEYIVTRFGKLPKDSYIKLDAYKENPYMEFIPCSKDDAYYWGVYAAPISEADKIDRIFSRLYFERVNIDDIYHTPKEKKTCVNRSSSWIRRSANRRNSRKRKSCRSLRRCVKTTRFCPSRTTRANTASPSSLSDGSPRSTRG